MVTDKMKDQRANNAVSYRIHLGEWPKASELLCSVCGKPADDYHHHLGYEQQHWYDVVPVCRSCHVRITKGLTKPNYWTQSVCVHCGKQFSVRKCYVKRGQGKFCSTGCGTTYRNILSNPSKRPEVRAKISLNHADVSLRKRSGGKFVKEAS